MKLIEILQLLRDNVLAAQVHRGHIRNTIAVAVCFRCSVRADCQDAAKDVLYWINYKSDRCTTIESVTPHQLQATTARTVSGATLILPGRCCRCVCFAVARNTRCSVLCVESIVETTTILC